MKIRGLFLGFLLSILGIFHKDFWLDEAIYYAVSKQVLPNLLSASLTINHPPLYFLFLHFWLRSGQSEFFLRLPSIIFGILSILLVYRISKTLFNEKVASFSLILFALSPLNVHFSGETRMYSLWTVLVLSSFYFFLKLLKNPKRIFFFLFSFFFLLSLYTHYSSILFFLSLNIFLLLKKGLLKEQLSSFFLWQLSAAVFFLPWFLPFLSSPHPPSWSFPLILGIPATFVSFVVGGLGQVTQRVYFFSSSVPFLIKIYLFTTSVFFFSIFLKGIRTRTTGFKKSLLLAVLFFPIILASFANFIHPLYSPRLFVAIAFPFYILTALGIESFENKKTIIKLKVVSIFLLFSVNLITNFYPSFKPETLRLATQFLNRNAENDTIVVHTSIYTYFSFLYYLPQFKYQYLILPSELTEQTTDIIGGTPRSIFELKKNRKIWLIIDYKGTKEEELSKIEKRLTGYSLVLKTNFDDVTILLFLPASM